MFCEYCGKPTGDNTRFCRYCGKKIRGENDSGFINERAVQRNNEIEEMKRMINYFSKKQDVYDEYDEVTREIHSLSKTSNAASYLLMMGLLALIGGFFLSTSLWHTPQVGIGIAVCISGAVLSFIGILMLVERSNNEKLLEEKQQRYFEISDELYNYYLEYQNCPIGPEYTNPANLGVILDTIISGRADTTKEAINILIEDAHRNRMEDIAAQTAEYTAKAAEQAGRAATGAKVAAFFSAANYLQTRNHLYR